MSSQTVHKYTLEEIAERKKQLQHEIQVQKKAIITTTREIFAPVAPTANKADASCARSIQVWLSLME